MRRMLKIYDHLDAIREAQANANQTTVICRHWASELMQELGAGSEEDLNRALERTFQVCVSLHIEISENFHRIYRYSGNTMHADWQLSDLGCYLLIVNGNTANPHVGMAQIHGMRKRYRG